MVKTDNNRGKIYGYNEDLWYEVIKSQQWTGDRDIGLIEMVFRKRGNINCILDLGCGVGRISNRLAAKGFKVTGIDLSSKCIDEAKRIAEETGVSKNTEYLVGDYKKFCASDETLGDFDAAICILAPAWKNLKEMRAFFKDLSGKIRKRGVLILTDFVKERFLSSLFSSPPIQRWFRFGGDILSLHTWKYDPISSRVRTEKEFYRRNGRILRFITKIEQDYLLYSINEYFNALSPSWKVEGAYIPPINIMRLDDFNDPWWLFSLIMIAERI